MALSDGVDRFLSRNHFPLRRIEPGIVHQMLTSPDGAWTALPVTVFRLHARSIL